MTPTDPDSQAVRRLFDAIADGFAEHDFVHRRTFDGLLERLEPMQLEPRSILDLGCAAGGGSRALSKRFRRARVACVDLSLNMLRMARRSRSRFLSRQAEVQADARRLPFATGAFDLVIANQLLPWIGEPDAVFAEVARCLSKEGLFTFASLGPDSYAEIRGGNTAAFLDMHDVGDALLRNGLRDPVLDVERLAVNYADRARLVADLEGSGAIGLAPASADEDPGDTGPDDAPCEVSLELVFGHAWGGGPANPPGEYRLEPGSIGRRRR